MLPGVLPAPAGGFNFLSWFDDVALAPLRPFGTPGMRLFLSLALFARPWAVGFSGSKKRQGFSMMARLCRISA